MKPQDHLEALAKELRDLAKERDSLRAERDGPILRISQLQRELHRMHEARAADRLRVAELRAEGGPQTRPTESRGDLLLQISQLQQELHHMREERDDARAARSRARTERDDAERERDEFTFEAAALQQQRDVLRMRIDELRQEIDTPLSGAPSRQKTLQAYARIDRLTRHVDAQEDRIDRLEDDLAQTAAALGALTSRVDRLDDGPQHGDRG